MLDSEFSDDDYLHSNHIESEDLLQDEDGGEGEGGDQFDRRGEEEESKGREE